MTESGWKWSIRPEAKDVASPPGFDSRIEAEAWLTQNWRALEEAGCDSVMLLHHDELVYEMSLEEA